VAVTATFRLLYVFVVIEHASRRLMHVNVTAHPSAAWTLQQMKEVVADADDHRYLLHDRDSIFAKHLDDSIRAMGLAVLRSPFASPKANSICKRVIGTIRRECLDWMIPISEAHLRSILRECVAHYNGGHFRAALGKLSRAFKIKEQKDALLRGWAVVNTGHEIAQHIRPDDAVHLDDKLHRDRHDREKR
jgi:transposase InsO family protein